MTEKFLQIQMNMGRVKGSVAVVEPVLKVY